MIEFDIILQSFYFILKFIINITMWEKTQTFLIVNINLASVIQHLWIVGWLMKFWKLETWELWKLYGLLSKRKLIPRTTCLPVALKLTREYFYINWVQFCHVYFMVACMVDPLDEVARLFSFLFWSSLKNWNTHGYSSLN